MKKLTKLILLLCMALSFSVMAQDDELLTVDIDSVGITGFKGVKSIVDKSTGDVIGHYLYYNNGANLQVSFMDLELNITKTVQLSLGIGDIQEAVFNGETILFYTLNKGMIQYYILSLQGDIISQFASTYVFTDDGKTMPYVIASEIDGGYYLLNPRLKDASLFGYFVGYNIDKVDKNFGVKWSKSFFPAAKKEGIMLQTAESGFDRLIVIQSNMASWLTNKMTGTELVCFDGDNGDELYRVSLFTNDFTSLPSQIVVDEAGNLTLGGEYFKGEKTGNVNSEGIFALKLDPSGGEISQNRSTWKEGIQQQLKRENFTFSGKNKVLFHDIVLTEDGGIQLIGESFSKKQTLGEGSALGMAAIMAARVAAKAAGIDPDMANKAAQMVDLKNTIIALATGRLVGSPFHDENRADLFNQDNIATPTILTIQEMIVFDYDQSLELTAVNQINKAYTNIYAYPPYRGAGGLTLAKIVKGAGFFDYSFTQNDAVSGKQIMVYNSMMSKKPNIGIVNMEKGTDFIPREFVIKNLRKYGSFEEVPKEEEGETTEEATPVEATEEVVVEDKEEEKKKKYSNSGVSQANGGKVLIYYIEKEKRSKIGTLKMFHETISTGM